MWTWRTINPNDLSTPLINFSSMAYDNVSASMFTTWSRWAGGKEHWDFTYCERSEADEQLVTLCEASDFSNSATCTNNTKSKNSGIFPVFYVNKRYWYVFRTFWHFTLSRFASTSSWHIKVKNESSIKRGQRNTCIHAPADHDVEWAWNNGLKSQT